MSYYRKSAVDPKHLCFHKILVAHTPVVNVLIRSSPQTSGKLQKLFQLKYVFFGLNNCSKNIWILTG